MARILSVGELAIRARLSPTTVLKLEARRNLRPAPQTIRKLADAFDMDARELLED
jgi:transcriptional regulator with XRE-family HTH domain